MKQEEVRALVASPRFGGENRLGKLVEAFESELAPAVREGGYIPIESKRFRSLKHVVAATNELEDGVVRFMDLAVYGNDGAYDQDDVAAVQSYLGRNDTVIVPYASSSSAAAASSSSSSAAPARGTPVTHASILASASAAAKSLGLTSTDVVVSTAPLHNPLALAAGFLAPSSVTAKVVLPNKVFDAAKTLLASSQQRATVLVTVPEHAAALSAELAADAAKPANKRAYDVSSLRAGVVLTSGAAGAAPVKIGAATLKSVDAAKGF